MSHELAGMGSITGHPISADCRSPNFSYNFFSFPLLASPFVNPSHMIAKITTVHDYYKYKSKQLIYVTENYAKQTFHAPCCCYESGLTMDLLLFKTINVSID